MLAVYLVEHIANLLLSQSLCVKHTSKTVAFLLLVAKNRQYLRVEVAVTVTGDAELQTTAMAISVAGAITIALVAAALTKILAALRYHHRLQHKLKNVM